MQTRFVVGAGLILGAIMVISMVTYFGNQEAYYTVDELVANSALYPVVAEAADGSAGSGPRLQLRGEIDYATVERADEGLELRFTLTGKNGRVPVVYDGLVPDTFDRAESVTVGGRLGSDGTFVADALYVQCPSKYVAEPPGAETVSDS
jgi:cytochrome c-type biogenesis protein CcmE